VLEFVFTDEDGQTVGLHVRRGIAEFLPEPADHYQKADFVLQLDAETWAKLYLSEIGLAEAIDSDAVELKQGNKDESLRSSRCSTVSSRPETSRSRRRMI
jgi:hypothetical protein